MTRLWYLLREACLGLGIAAVAACGDNGPADNTPAPHFTLSVSPSQLLTVAGASNSATVTIERTNFPDAITLELLDPPEGIAAFFDPTPVSASASALVVSAAENAIPGDYQLTILGTAAGSGERGATLMLTVAEPSTSGLVEYLFCNPADIPDFFAYQDGTGTWQAVPGSAHGQGTAYRFALTQGYGGVLLLYRDEAGIMAAAANRMSSPRRVDIVRSGRQNQLRFRSGASPASSAEVYYTWLLYGSAAELAHDGLVACAQDPPAKTVSGNVTGVPPGAYGIVSVGYITHIFDGAASSNPMTFAGVPGGPVDLIGSRTTPGNTPDRVILVRNLSLLDGGTLPAEVNYTGSGSSAPASAAANVTGGGGDDLEIFVDLVTPNGQAGLWFDLSPSPTATRAWAGLRPEVMQPGDLHGLFAFASATDGSGDFRHAIKYVRPVEDQTLTLGPVISPLAASLVDGGAYPRFRFQSALPVEYDKRLTVDVFSFDDGNVYSIFATGAYLEAAGSVGAFDLTMPDVAGLAGFPAAARLTPGTNTVVVSAAGWRNGPGIFELRPTLGAELKASTRYGTITVP